MGQVPARDDTDFSARQVRGFSDCHAQTVMIRQRTARYADPDHLVRTIVRFIKEIKRDQRRMVKRGIIFSQKACRNMTLLCLLNQDLRKAHVIADIDFYGWSPESAEIT